MKFLDGDPESIGKEPLESSVEPSEENWDVDEEWELSLSEPAKLEDAEGVAPAVRSKYETMLGTFLNVQLSLVGGFWVGVVPTALVSSGSAVGGWSGGIVSTLLLAVSSQIFLVDHPTFPIKVEPRSYGWEITNRATGKKTYLQITEPREADRAIIESHRDAILEQRESARANRLEAAALKAERRRLKRAAKKSKRAVGGPYGHLSRR